jgi:hypothetical protein
MIQANWRNALVPAFGTELNAYAWLHSSAAGRRAVTKIPRPCRRLHGSTLRECPTLMFRPATTGPSNLPEIGGRAPARSQLPNRRAHESFTSFAPPARVELKAAVIHRPQQVNGQPAIERNVQFSAAPCAFGQGIVTSELLAPCAYWPPIRSYDCARWQAYRRFRQSLAAWQTSRSTEQHFDLSLEHP